MVDSSSLLGLPFTYTYPQTTQSQGHSHGYGHARSTSKSSVYSSLSSIDSTAESVNTALTTPPPQQRLGTPPVRQHGPILLPKIRSQDQDVDGTLSVPQPRRAASLKATPPPQTQQHKIHKRKAASTYRPVAHTRSYTSPDSLNSMAYAHMSFTGLATPSPSPEDQQAPLLLCSPARFVQDASVNMPSTAMASSPAVHTRRASSCSSVDASTIEKYGYPTYRQVPFMAITPQPEFPANNGYVSYTPRAHSPLTIGTATPEPVPAPASTTTLINYLTGPNPAASLVRSLAFPIRDSQIKHFWWDVRNITAWSSFTADTIFSLPGASSLLTTPIPAPALVHQSSLASRHPETEAALHSIYASYYLPKLNSALAVSSSRPLQLSVPPAPKTATGGNELLFTLNPLDAPPSAASIFGGKPTARAVGVVRSFDRFNTGMRAESNIKRVEYLRTLAALHHQMREHSSRYGFILTEIELVVVRNGTASPTPFFGDLEVATVQLANSSSSSSSSSTELTACLALWGLCQMAGDEPASGQAHWKSEIGAPAEGTRRRARPRDAWMPQPQLAEKREAKRSRGWVWPEDAVGRKELGKRGVRYGGV